MTAIRSASLGLALLALATTASTAGADGWGALPITAEQRTVDEASGTVDHTGNAVLDIGILRVEAQRITEHRADGAIVRLSASGDPIVFDVPGQARGEARAAELSVVERRMTLIDYTVSDPGGNRMRGRKLTLTFR